jgi:hypothetical protein
MLKGQGIYKKAASRPTSLAKKIQPAIYQKVDFLITLSRF